MLLEVNEQSPEVKAMAEHWPVVDALLAGTPAMRKAGSMFLPKWPNEDAQAYDNRLAMATLFPAFERTVAVMSGKPFSKQLQLSDDTPPEIRELSEDIDNEGVNLHAFAAEMFREIMSAGIAGILVEAPKPIRTEGPAPTVKEEREAGVRPYWVRIKHRQILGWRLKIVSGKARLMQLRLAEEAKEDEGLYGEKTMERVRVLEPGKWEVFEKREVAGKIVWVSVEQGQTSLDFIPYVPLYGLRRSLMIGAPPLLNLAYLNVKHWQSQSDQDTILHVARVPILFGKGFPDGTTLTVGASFAVLINSATAELEYVEHTGGAITAGKESLEDLEAQMIQSGAELLVAYGGTRTATEDANDAEGNKCDLQRMVENFEDSLDQALDFTAKYKKIPNGGKASLFKDFAAFTLSDASDNLIIQLQGAGLLTKATTLKEMQRRGKLSPDIKVEDEIAAAAAEGPAPGTDADED